MKRMQIYFPYTLYFKIKDYAEKNKKSVNHVVRSILNKFFIDNKEVIGKDGL